MRIKLGAKVVAENDEKVGEIEKVVIDPKTEEITHVVIRKGFLFSEDKLVPVSLLGIADEDEIRLRAPQEEIELLPDFESRKFLLYSDLDEAYKQERGYATPVIMYPPAGLGHVGMGMPAQPPLVAKVEENIPEDSVAIQDGADVIGMEGEKVGEVEEVFIDPELDQANYILVSKGFILKERKLVPMDWVQELKEGKIHLAVNTKIIEQLPDYPQGVPE